MLWLGNFHGIPVYIDAWVEKGCVYLVGKKPKIDYIVSDSFQTVVDKLDNEFLRTCGILGEVKS